MLDLSIQLAAACGPIALAVMGVIVSLNPPSGSRKTHRIWAGAFAAVGILSASAIFFELRGTDQILGQIWEHIKEPQHPAINVAENVPRLSFMVIPASVSFRPCFFSRLTNSALNLVNT